MIDCIMIKGRFVWVLSAVLVMGTLILLSYKNHNVKIRPSYQTSSMKNLHLTHKNEKNTQWELTADNAVFPTGGQEVFLDSLDLKINNSPGISLSSNNGIYEIEKGNIILSNSVELKMKDAKFLTETLKFNSSNDTISTDGYVQFTGNKFFIEGTGLAAQVKHQRVKILKNVKATFYY